MPPTASLPGPGELRRRRRLAAVNDPRWDWARRRTTRRWLVVATGLALAVFVHSGLLLFVDNNTPRPTPVAPGSAAYIVMFVVRPLYYLVGSLSFYGLMWLVLGPATRGVYWLEARFLDERQEALKRLVLQRCYTALALLAGPAAVAIAVISAIVIGPGPVDWLATATWLVVGLGQPLMYGLYVLPAAVGAWIGPDERGEPEPPVSPL
jgi:hypothetical protein